MGTMTARSKDLNGREPIRTTINGKPYVNVYEAARVLDVHWTRIYALLRKNQFKGVRGQRRRGKRQSPLPGRDDNQTFIPLTEITRYQKQATWWNRLHSPKT